MNNGKRVVKEQLEGIRDLFNQLTGGHGFEPYPYQERVAEHLFSGRNVILSAPTGAGKTWAALLPFLYSKKIGESLFDRLIFALPLRTLATTLFKDTVTACQMAFGQDTVVTVGKDRDYQETAHLYITIQTGEQQDDPFFEGDIVFTTIDQLLSSYFMMPVSLPPRLGNINAGALLGSFLVFDEFHLLEPDRAMGTTLEMLDRLKPFCRFLVMTATMSGRTQAWLADTLQAEQVYLSGEEVMSLPCHREKQRAYCWVPEPLEVGHVLEHHGKGRSIVLVNTVKRAQDLYVALKRATRETSTQVLLLHSRFYPQDRKQMEDKLKEYLGKEATRTDVILVTTQVIEAGMDISADNLHTELAPMNSLVQRAGRCARYGGPRSIGTVWVYELERGEDQQLKWGPYRDEPTRELLESSRQMLSRLDSNGKVVSSGTEHVWVDEVHTQAELAALQVFANLYERRRMVHDAMENKMKDAVRQLIRDVASISLIITDDPDSLRFDRTMWPRMISVPRVSLFALTEAFEGKGGGQWVAKIPAESKALPGGALQWDWEKVSSVRRLLSAPWLIAIHPDAASYSPDLGLQLGVSGHAAPVIYDHRPPLPRYQLEYETFREHTERVISQCRQMAHKYETAVRAIEMHGGMTNEKCEQLFELACALHDVGKLTKQWQAAMRAWQEFKDASKLMDEPLAHTDYEPEVDWQKRKQFPKQGSHAMEGAFAVSQGLLEQELSDDVAAVVWTAIARHHAPHTRSLGSFQLIDRASEILQKSVPENFEKGWRLVDQPNRDEQQRFTNDLLSFQRQEDYPLWPLYVLVVRRLRLADQGSMKNNR
ncbi:MAG: hypothetical protein DRH17_06620 [Deltaproteobacteria bacterium]|nr:MAG: hypothetical protein DRH17_06620 [Deltaproteobacteria bacterium]